MASFNVRDERNLTMLMDFYELTMANGYFELGFTQREAVFDMFFRTIPDQAGFAIFAGLEQLVETLVEMKFSDEDVEFLRSKHCFSDGFLDYLKSFKFSCDVYAVKEGTPVFPNEPLVIVKGPIIQAQLIETFLLLNINHQSLIATKANRIVRAAEGRRVLEFGSRRAQSYDAAILGARAAYIGGCMGTACVIADRDYKIPSLGTMAHSWVQLFDSEYEAFKAYAECYPHNCNLLIDTYNVIKSGIPNAIRVFNEYVVPKGFRPTGVRIDSGDIAYLSKKARVMLDEAGYPDVPITASNSLDEYIIRDLLRQGAQVDSFGVGENLITSRSHPVFGGVYKLVAAEDAGGKIQPRIKISETIEKITTPHFKKLYRFFDKSTGQAIADYITVYDEPEVEAEGLTIFDPVETWKKKTLHNAVAKPLLEKIFEDGKLVYEVPDIEQVRSYCGEQLDSLWDEVKRFENPHRYYVDLSQKLWDIKHRMLEEGHS